MIVTEILARNARMYPEETALIERNPQQGTRLVLSWREFDGLADRIAAILSKRGVGKGDRVVQLMMNGIYWLPVYFGILRAGAVVVPLNYRFDAITIRKCVQTAQAKVMIFGPEFVERILSEKGNLDTWVRHYLFAEEKAECSEFAEDLLPMAAALSEDALEPQRRPLLLTDPAGLYFTSGTTGDPKGVLLTHRNLESACYIENAHHRQQHEDNFLLIPPLYHTGAKMHWFGNFIVGAKAVILKGADPQSILEAVSEEQATIVWLLVPWALDILFAIESGEIKLNRYRLAQWRLMHIGAQPVPPSLIREWRKHFPVQQYDTNYGLTESTGPGCVHLGIENTHKIGAIGKAGFDWEARIVTMEGNPVCRGEAGELVIRGPGVMQEYYRNPDATREVLIDGWLHTGDIAREDPDGFIWLVDRKKDVIITGGENIYPVEIEDYLQSHVKIQDVAVIGIPSLRLGEIPVAIVQLKPGMEASKEEILGFCEGLPRYKRPRKIFFDTVPRNPTGKIEKPRLRKHYGGIPESFQIG
jgi:acyl-CoA synthetase (AMP-forming)/AMP-acid ligase II